MLRQYSKYKNNKTYTIKVAYVNLSDVLLVPSIIDSIYFFKMVEIIVLFLILEFCRGNTLLSTLHLILKLHATLQDTVYCLGNYDIFCQFF